MWISDIYFYMGAVLFFFAFGGDGFFLRVFFWGLIDFVVNEAVILLL